MYYLRTHTQVVHEKQRKFKCDRCKQTFREKRCLTKHIKKISFINKNFLFCLIKCLI